MFSKYY